MVENVISQSKMKRRNMNINICDDSGRVRDIQQSPKKGSLIGMMRNSD